VVGVGGLHPGPNEGNVAELVEVGDAQKLTLCPNANEHQRRFQNIRVRKVREELIEVVNVFHVCTDWQLEVWIRHADQSVSIFVVDLG
jgi:hypothetical protein